MLGRNALGGVANGLDIVAIRVDDDRAIDVLRGSCWRAFIDMRVRSPFSTRRVVR
jgi:hypothetical protein